MAPSKSYLLTLFVVTLVAFPGSFGYIQELVVHMSPFQNGTYFVFRDNVPQVASGLLDLSQAYCTRGFWIGYNEIEYEGASANLHGYTSDLTCFNQSFLFKSFRHGGSIDTAVNQLGVYPQEGYQGREVVITGPALAILSGKSFLNSGNLNWTLYESQNFGEPSICSSTAAQYESLGIYGHTNVTASLNITQIGSVLRGCTDAERAESLKLHYELQGKNEVGDYVRRLFHW